MMRKFVLYALFLLLVCPLSSLYAQRYTLTVNGDTLKHKSTYDYFPNYMRIYVKSVKASYSIQSGKISLARNRGVTEEVKLDTSFFKFSYLEHDIMPRDKIIIDLYKLKNDSSGKIRNTQKFFIIDLAKNLDIKPDSTCGLLINNSVSHYKSGFDPGQIEEVEILLMGDMKEAPIQLKQFRDNHSLFSKRFNNAYHFNNEASQVLKDIKLHKEDKLYIDVMYRGEDPDKNRCNIFTAVD